MKIILKKPIITEKAIGQAQDQYYTFEVAMNANKHQIKEAVEKLFNVNVLSVRTQTRQGSEKRVGRMRRPVMGSTTKRAIVKLTKGQTIDLFTVPTGEVADESADQKEKKEEPKKK